MPHRVVECGQLKQGNAMTEKTKVKLTPTPPGEGGRELTPRERTGRFWVPGVVVAALCLACLGRDRPVMPEVRADQGGLIATPSARSRFPLAGRVKIDGHAPDGKGDLIVLLEGPRLGKIEDAARNLAESSDRRY